MKHKSVSFCFACFSVTAAVSPLALRAQSGDWSQYCNRTWTYSTAAGSMNRINSEGDLAQFASLVSAGTSFAGTTVRIEKDLDLSPHYWIPAGSPGARFAGTLTALRNTRISGMNIRDCAYTMNTGCAGLVAYLDAAGDINSIVLTNTVVNIINPKAMDAHNTNRVYIGSIAGYSEGNIMNCSNEGSVEMSGGIALDHAWIGGIVGLGGFNVEKCSNAGSVAGFAACDSDVGGIAGENRGTVIYCSNSSGVQSSSLFIARVGGIVGLNYFATLIECENKGAVGGSVPPTGYWEACVGGIAGADYFNMDPTPDGVRPIVNTIVDCVNRGAVTGASHVAAVFVGGISGAEGGTILRGVNHAEISASNETAAVNVGGIAGGNWYYLTGTNSLGIIESCVNESEAVVSGFGWHEAFVGGVAGNNSGASVYIVNGGEISNSENRGAVGSSGVDFAYAGGIACDNYGTIKNCVNRGEVVCSDADQIRVGGIVDKNRGPMADVVNHGSVNGFGVNAGNIGGIAGEIYVAGNWKALAVITNAVNHGKVSGICAKRCAVGGLVGDSHYVIANSVNHGMVTASASQQCYAGGIIGGNFSETANLVNHGMVTGYGDTYTAVGGIVGYNDNFMMNGINYGPSSAFGVNNTFVGGLAGSNLGTLANFINHGVPDPASKGNPLFIGGVVGGNSWHLEHCYWNLSDRFMPKNSCGVDNYGCTCASFDVAPGVPVPSYYGFNDLCADLNQWINRTLIIPPLGTSSYFPWTLAGSPDGYPWFGFGEEIKIQILPGGNIADVPGVDFPGITLPLGGWYKPSTGRATDDLGGFVYDDKSTGVLITKINVSDIVANNATNTIVDLRFDQEPVVLLGKDTLTNPLWTYLNRSAGVTVSGYDAVINATTLDATHLIRFFTAQSSR